MSKKREPERWITVNGKHIPIYEDDESDKEVVKQRALDKLEEMDDSIMTDIIKTNIPKIGKKETDELTKIWSRIKQSDRKKLPEETVDVSHIKTFQGTVNKRGISRIIKGENVEHQNDKNPIYAMAFGEDVVLMDGNHRVVAGILMGQKKFKIKVYRKDN